MKINIYINIAVFGSVNEVLFTLLDKIYKSELYKTCNKVYLIVNGDINKINIELKDKYEIINENKDISKCEFPTLEKIWLDSKNDDFNILYLHTKGVTKPNIQSIIDWTNYLSYFNIINWKDRLNEIIDNDCSGVNLYGNHSDLMYHPLTWGYGKAPLHYSGNFWWSKSSHIRKLPNPINWLPDDNYIRWRIMAEMWVCQISDSKYYNAWNSNVNHYIENYPANLYQ